MSKRRPIPPATLIALAMIAVTLVFLWQYGQRFNLVPCHTDCGETFIALHQARSYQLYGFRYGIIEDHATAPRLEARPFLYTHNVNLGGVIFPLLEAVGVHGLSLKFLFILLVFGIGLFYVYKAVSFHFSSNIVGLSVLALFCSEYIQVLSFGLNALRAWHWVALFGLVYHVGRLARQSDRVRKLDIAATLLLALIAMGLGYDFLAISFFTSLFVFAFCRAPEVSLGRSIRFMVFLVAAFSLPVLLRQVQIAAVLGLGFWSTDLYYTALIKVPFLDRLFPLPSMSEVDAFYESVGVLRPPARPFPSLSALFATMYYPLMYSTLPIAGLMSFILTALAATFSTFIVVGRKHFAVRRHGEVDPVTAAEQGAGRTTRWLLNCFGRLSGHGFFAMKPGGGLLLTAGLYLGIGLGIAVFSSVSLSIYFKHLFPLTAAVFLIPKGALIAAGVIWIFRHRGHPLHALAAGAIIAIVAADHVKMQADNLAAHAPMSTAWIPAVRERKTHSFAVSWIAPAAAAFTKNWVVGLKPGIEAGIVRRVSAGEAPFRTDEYLLFGERDRDAAKGVYERPDFWLYFPTDRRVPIDRLVPDCRRDYLSAFLARLWLTGDKVVTVYSSWVRPGKVRPGDALAFGARLNSGAARVSGVSAVRNGAVIATGTYNCIYDRFSAVYRVPKDAPPGIIELALRIDYADGRSVRVPVVRIEVSPEAPPSPQAPVRVPAPQPKPRDLVKALPKLQVAASGDDFVIFDLRPYYRAELKN